MTEPKQQYSSARELVEDILKFSILGRRYNHYRKKYTTIDYRYNSDAGNGDETLSLDQIIEKYTKIIDDNKNKYLLCENNNRDELMNNVMSSIPILGCMHPDDRMEFEEMIIDYYEGLIII